MIQIRTRGATPVALLARLLCGMIFASLSSADAWALKVDPEWAANEVALQTARAHPFASMTREMHPLALDRRRGLIAPHVTEQFRQIDGIRITPATAIRKLNGLKPQLVELLIRVQEHFDQPLHIISGCRSKKHNRRVGGARRSQHLHCKAADFQIPGVSKRRLAAFLKEMPGRGGVGVYCRSSYVHLDVGPKRQWSSSCKKRKRSNKRRSRRKVAKLSEPRRRSRPQTTKRIETPAKRN